MKKFFLSFVFAARGVKHNILHERNFKVHIVAAIAAIATAIWLKCTAMEWIVIIACIVAVLSMEMLNTAIERICNIVQPENDKRIAIIKDVAAGAVLITAIGAAICGLIIFLPKMA